MKDDGTQDGTGSLSDFGIAEDPGASFMARFLEVLAPVDGRSPGVIVMRSRALELLKKAKAEGVLDQTIRQMVLFTGAAYFLPPSYAKFQPVVVEGLIFLISQLPLKRLADKMVDQLRLSLSATPGERLFTLVKDMPSLQKLGQIICRSPGLDPQVKDSLTDLEDKIETVTYGRLRPFLKKAIQTTGPEFTITPEKKILAEASVCAVVPAKVRIGKKGPDVSSVLKMVKPAVRKNLPTELLLLDRTVTFLDDNRSRWGLGDFSFQGTLSQVRRLLENEVDLTMEQANLDKALSYHASDNAVLVPVRSAASTPLMTVMSRLDGAKITDVCRSDRQGKTASRHYPGENLRYQAHSGYERGKHLPRRSSRRKSGLYFRRAVAQDHLLRLDHVGTVGEVGAISHGSSDARADHGSRQGDFLCR